jgi:hypothetical protein
MGKISNAIALHCALVDPARLQTLPHARGLLLPCDGGGSNGSNRHVFKEALQYLAVRLELEIRISHYPPYCSKHNPIEHRLFAHLTRACQGVTFHTVGIARQFMEKTKTTTGLKVTVEVLGGVYVKGRKSRQTFWKTCVSFSMSTCRAGTIGVSRPTADLGKLFLATSLRA